MRREAPTGFQDQTHIIHSLTVTPNLASQNKSVHHGHWHKPDVDRSLKTKASNMGDAKAAISFPLKNLRALRLILKDLVARITNKPFRIKDLRISPANRGI